MLLFVRRSFAPRKPGYLFLNRVERRRSWNLIPICRRWRMMWENLLVSGPLSPRLALLLSFHIEKCHTNVILRGFWQTIPFCFTFSLAFRHFVTWCQQRPFALSIQTWAISIQTVSRWRFCFFMHFSPLAAFSCWEMPSGVASGFLFRMNWVLVLTFFF